MFRAETRALGASVVSSAQECLLPHPIFGASSRAAGRATRWRFAWVWNSRWVRSTGLRRGLWKQPSFVSAFSTIRCLVLGGSEDRRSSGARR